MSNHKQQFRIFWSVCGSIVCVSQIVLASKKNNLSFIKTLYDFMGKYLLPYVVDEI